ncbi:MAG: HAD family hydrolase [Armatimonadetes bacterium]|nr:HAD family hydrolase [Armatimonadota bacterium]
MSFSMVRRHLETLKYMSYPDDGGMPSGEGVPVEIVAMPDLVLDFREDALFSRDPRDKVLGIGGRAARLAMMLLDQSTDDDGLYRVHLATKTSPLGRYFLRDKQEARRCPQRSDRELLHCVIGREGGEVRTALRKSNSGALPTIARRPERGGELGPADLARHSLRRLLLEARVIYFSSIVHEPYRPLLTGLLEELDRLQSMRTTPPPVSLFADASHATEGEQVEVLCRLRNCQGAHIAGVFVADDAFQAVAKHLACQCRPQDFDDEARWGDLANALGVPLIRFGKSLPPLYARPGEPVLRGQGASVDRNEEGLSDAFRAGVVLAEATRRAVADLAARARQPKADSTLIATTSEMVTEWGAEDLDDPSCWDRILDCGTDLVSDHRRGLSPSTVRNWPQLNATDNANHRLAVERIPPERLVELALAREYALDCRKADEGPDTGGDADVARDDSEGDKRSELDARCSPNDDETPVASGAKAPEPEIGVMLDLDATLINSTQQREAMLRLPIRKLIEGLHAQAKSRDPRFRYLAYDDAPEAWEALIDAWLDRFTNAVYRPHLLFNRLDYGDFRQAWNCVGWYATLLLLSEAHQDELGGAARTTDPKRIRRIEEVERQLRHLGQLKGEGAEKQIGSLRLGTDAEPDWVEDLRSAYRAVLADQRALIEAARDVFWETPITPLKEARDLLRSLTVEGRFRVYVVSEGAAEVQWDKIRRAGLDEFIPAHMMLTTSEAAQPANDHRMFKDELNRLRAERGNAIDDLRRARDTLGQIYALVKLPLQESIEHARRLQSELDCPSPEDCPLTALPAEAERAIAGFEREYLVRCTSLTDQLALLERQITAQKLVGDVFERMEHKEYLTFYSAAIRAILHRPDAPRQCLASVSELFRREEGLPKMRLAMVGDRQENDMAPPLELLSAERLLAIRLNCGSYVARGQNPPKPHLAPAYEADTLAQVKAVLLGHDWSSQAVAVEPDFYRCTLIGSGQSAPKAGSDLMPVSLEVLVDGICMVSADYDVIPRVCAGILAECLQRDRDNPPTAWASYCTKPRPRGSSARNAWHAFLGALERLGHQDIADAAQALADGADQTGGH